MRSLRILYAALDQTVPGTLGGSVHVQSTAEGLAALGHEVHVASTPGGTWPAGPVHWHAMSPPLGQPILRWVRTGRVETLARAIRADVIMERYYNFGGEGVMAAKRLGLPAVLEVNAPIVDYPGASKARLDRALIVEPMRRWRDHLCRHVDLFVTPIAAIVPAWVDRARILEAEWGADTEAFRPGLQQTPGIPRSADRIWCVFAGAFRPWHGAARLAEALAQLHAAGDQRFGGVFIGNGPERTAAEAAAAGVPAVVFTGAVSHDRLPALLAGCDIGVAPFEPERHPPLALAFYWSPLKVFEYMAAGLPVVAPRLPRLAALVEHGREGWLYDRGAPDSLASALVALADADMRRKLGTAARDRAVRDFSWRAHCEALDRRLRELHA